MASIPPTQPSQNRQGLDADLAFSDRLYVTTTASVLPSSQLEHLITALDPPAAVMPPKAASRRQQSKALLDWVEGPTGPGLSLIDEKLRALVPGCTTPKALVLSNSEALSTVDLTSIMQRLRQKTGDDSLSLAFYRSNSRQLGLNGSSEGLAKLQALFDSGELSAAQGYRIESLDSIAANATDARKARLIQALVLEVQQIRNAHEIALDVYHDLDRLQDCKGIRNVLRILDQARQQARHIDQTHNRVSARTLDRTLSRVRDRILERARTLSLEVDHNHIRDVIKALDQDRFDDALDTLDRALVREQTLTGKIMTAGDIARDISIARNLAFNLTRVFSRSNILSLVGIDLAGANLNGLNLVGIDLTGTNLTDAMVKDAVFGNNSGITDADKTELQQRGAVFQTL